MKYNENFRYFIVLGFNIIFTLICGASAYFETGEPALLRFPIRYYIFRLDTEHKTGIEFRAAYNGSLNTQTHTYVYMYFDAFLFIL